MKKLFSTAAIVCLLLLASERQPVHAAVNRTVNFDLSSSRAVPKNVHGVNTNWYGFLPITQSVTQNAIKDLGLTQIRFPGGTVGNYYNWKQFTPGWALINSLPDVPGDIKGLKPRYDFHIQELSPLIFDPIIRAMGKEGTYVVNFSYNTNDEIIAGFNKMKQAGITVQRLEFGNELYFREAPELTPEVYMQRAEVIDNEAKQLWPNVKTALVIDRYYWREGAGYSWPIDNLPWYDAVITHAYSFVGSKSFDTYIPWVTGNENDADSRRQDFAEFIAEIQSRYPGKELWLTEWDIAEQEDKFANTYAQTFYVYDFLLGVLQYPVVTVANHHSLNDIFKIKAAILARYFDPARFAAVPNNQYTVDQFFVKRAAYWPLAWIGQAFSRYNRFAIGVPSQQNITTVYFYNQANPDKGSVALINKDSAAVTVSMTGLSFASPQLKLTTLVKPWDAKSNENAEFSPATTTVSASNITLPPYAIAYLSPQSGAPTPNPADLTDDGDTPGDEVNIFDYNVLIAGFGTTYDIFDYNELVERFGE